MEVRVIERDRVVGFERRRDAARTHPVPV